jgi:hypothetical protein
VGLNPQQNNTIDRVFNDDGHASAIITAHSTTVRQTSHENGGFSLQKRLFCRKKARSVDIEPEGEPEHRL